MPIRLPAICDYHQTRSPLEKGLFAGIISHGLSCRCDELCLFEALHPAPLARPFSKGLRTGDYLTWTFIPLRQVVPLRGALSCAFGAALLQGPTRGGLSHMGFHAAATNCTSSRHSILRLGEALLQGPTRGDYLTWAFMPLRRIVPLRGTLSCAFGAALLQGPTRGRNILVPSHSFFISFSDGVK